MSPRWRGCLFEIVETVVLTLLIFFVVQNFVAQPYQILQVSMQRTLNPGEYVLVDKLSPHFSDYKRGDVIVFEPPNGYSEDARDIPFIKRVIGIAGDTVEVKDEAVWVNGVKLVEPYVYDGQATTPIPITGTSVWQVPKDSLFVLGDHREASQDSRVFGPIAKSSVIGRAWLRYWGGPFGFVGSASYSGIPDPATPNASPSP
jgi:signal peptidase I